MGRPRTLTRILTRVWLQFSGGLAFPAVRRLLSVVNQYRVFGWLWLAAILHGCAILTSEDSSVTWQPVDLSFQTTAIHSWDEFPLQVTFVHEETVHTLDAFAKGGREWGVRFAPSRSGLWRWHVGGADTVGARQGRIRVRDATLTAVQQNANLRGHLKAVQGQRYFRRADGSATFLLADTNWYALTCRSGIDTKSEFCGQVLDHDVSFGRPDSTTAGPANDNFSVWLKDRAAKGFNAVLIRYVPNNLNGSNEGGCAFPHGPDAFSLEDCSQSDWNNLNPGFFDAADQRLADIWRQGLIIMGHPNWLASSASTLTQAKNLTRYLIARYGAYSLVWSLSGEFQNSGGKQTVWTTDPQEFEPFRELGRSLRDPSQPDSWFEATGYDHPVSIHPIGSPSAGVTAQTSLVFDQEPWLDHHWVQTFVHPQHIEARIKESWAASEKPVFLSEPCYEGFFQNDACDRYQSRFSVWVSMLSGAAGHAYGAQGVFRMNGSTVANLKKPGALDVVRAVHFFEKFAFNNLAPVACDQPKNDQRRPVCARQENTWLIYMPRGSAFRSVPKSLKTSPLQVVWFDPRTGEQTVRGGAIQDQLRSFPKDQDWVLSISRKTAL